MFKDAAYVTVQNRLKFTISYLIKPRALIGFEVLMVVTKKNMVFCVVTPNYTEKTLLFRALIFQSDNYVEKAPHSSLRSLRNIFHCIGILFKSP
jgi:hypothetical protein